MGAGQPGGDPLGGAERFRLGLRCIVRGAAALLAAEAMLLISYHWTRGGPQDFVSAAVLLWGAWETTRGFLQARGAAEGPLEDRFLRLRTTLFIGIAVAGSVGYWLWYVGQVQRARLAARWDMNAGTFGTFDAIEARMFARLNAVATDDEWLKTWKEFAPDLAAFRPSFEDAHDTGTQLAGLLRRETRRREMRDSLKMVDLYLKEAEIYAEIDALFDSGEPGEWPQGLRERLDSLSAVLQRIRSIQDSESEGAAGPPMRPAADCLMA